MKCPYCQNPIEEGLSKCPFCDKPLGTLPAKKAKWYQRTSSIVIGFLVVGPFILPAVWANPQYSRKTKIIISAICLFLTYLLTRFFVNSVKSITDYYGQMLNY